MHLALASAVLWGAPRPGASGARSPARWPAGSATGRGCRCARSVGLRPGRGRRHLHAPRAALRRDPPPRADPRAARLRHRHRPALLPFFGAFETLVRRPLRIGSLRLPAAVGGVLGRVLLLAVLGVGLAIGALPGVIALVAPAAALPVRAARGLRRHLLRAGSQPSRDRGGRLVHRRLADGDADADRLTATPRRAARTRRWRPRARPCRSRAWRRGSPSRATGAPRGPRSAPRSPRSPRVRPRGPAGW